MQTLEFPQIKKFDFALFSKVTLDPTTIYRTAKEEGNSRRRRSTRKTLCQSGTFQKLRSPSFKISFRERQRIVLGRQSFKMVSVSQTLESQVARVLERQNLRSPESQNARILGRQSLRTLESQVARVSGSRARVSGFLEGVVSENTRVSGSDSDCVLRSPEFLRVI